MHPQFNWNGHEYFSRLVAENKLAANLGFSCLSVTGLNGFEEALANMQERIPMVCVSDSSDGAVGLESAPNVDRVKTVFLAMPHALDDMEARDACLDQLLELFRQFLSRLIRDREHFRKMSIYLNPKIEFHEISPYILTGYACAYFHIHTNSALDLRYVADEWI